MREHDLARHGPHDLGTDRMVRDDSAAFEAMTTAELKQMCTDLSIAAALAVPGGTGQAAIERQLARAATVLAAREGSPPIAG
ncbi:MAG TPA: hypothetical protein VFW50_08785 [Streptosporangiaceae bacterium]|nr:hypothetical protein [Streptosporangiaceae bacterium]